MKDLFILGAGSSKPYGFPIGSELRQWAIDNIEVVFEENAYLKSCRIAPLDLENFKTAFVKSNTNSIDLFLTRNRQYEMIGKSAIAHKIIACEKKGLEYVEDKTDDWYFYFFNRLSERITDKSNVKDVFESKMFMTFNYDRSFEEYMSSSIFFSFFSTHPTSDDIDHDVVPKPDMLHIYGSIGEYPAKPYSTSRRYVQEVGKFEIDSIKTIYDERLQNAAIQERISLADRIFFLGFAYLPENMEKLGITQRLISGKEIYGTAFNNLEGEVRRIERYFDSARIVQIKSVKSTDLLKMYL